ESFMARVVDRTRVLSIDQVSLRKTSHKAPGRGGAPGCPAPQLA
ncbi:MAG: hypothetical protein QOD55_2623, partial [Solirubrobacteraceae bacterium]|nr:hypothetical protein [Solirubrobacteraceae bacterium]